MSSPVELLQDFQTLNERIRNSRHWFFATVVIACLIVPRFHTGIATAAACLFISATLLSLSNFARERGLWMLAILWGVFSLLFYFAAAFGPLAAAWNGNRPAWPVLLDLAIAARLLWWQIRTLALFARVNSRVLVLGASEIR